MRARVRESDIERALVARVKALGGETRKLSWVGRWGAPDRIVFLQGRVIFVELKAPGAKPAPHQAREIERLRALGAEVYVIDSLGKIEEVLNAYS